MGMEWDGVGVERMGWGGWDGMAAYGLGVYGMGAYGKGAYGIGRGDPWLHGWSVTSPPCAHPQVRRAIQQMLFHGKNFSWIRHVAIAVVLLTFINLLVIFAPSILGIFGMIGEQQRWHPAPPTCPPPAAPSPVPVPPGAAPQGRAGPGGGCRAHPALSVTICRRCHLCPLPHLHLPGHLLHPHHAQGQGAPALHPQNPGKPWAPTPGCWWGRTSTGTGASSCASGMRHAAVPCRVTPGA